MSNLKAITQKIFQVSLESVLPRNLILKALHRNGNSLTVNNRTYNLENNVYVVGFGKAVLGNYAFLYFLICFLCLHFCRVALDSLFNFLSKPLQL